MLMLGYKLDAFVNNSKH